MEFTQEFIEQQKLSEDQVKEISDFAKNYIANEKKSWDGKANENAEKILSGAVNYTLEKTGVKLERQQGEKYADFLQRVSDTHFENRKNEIESLKSDYEIKLKEFKGGEALKSELEQTKSKLDEVLKKYADYDEIQTKAVRAEEYGEELSKLKLEVAFDSVKPSFPESVNKYEAKAKWGDFRNEVLDKNIIELVNGIPMAINKENNYITTKLSDLVSKNEQIQELLNGRQQHGTGAEQVDLREIKGVPFQVPKDADAKTRSKLIKEYLATQNIDSIHPEYSAKFAELNHKILKGKTV